LLELEVDTSLLMVELDAEEPAWVSSIQIQRLAQRDNEPLLTFIERSRNYIVDHPRLTTVVVALTLPTIDHDLESSLTTYGAGLLPSLQGRTKVRLLFSAPPNIPDPLRRRLLSLITQLTAAGKGHYSCVIGAHFSASAPSSSKIAIPTIA
jgi:hypothetical protein